MRPSLSCISLQAHRPAPLLRLQESGMSRTDGEATRADPATTLYYTERILLQCYSILSVSCYCTILYRYWADPAKMLYYTDTERILLQCYTIPIPSGSCCYIILYCADPATVLYRYWTDPATIRYHTERILLHAGIPKISPSSSWIQSTVASCMTTLPHTFF